MLTKDTIEFLVELSSTIPTRSYKVKEWRELAELKEGLDEEKCKAYLNQLKINGCVDIKYFDEQEICFALTDKTNLIVDDYKILNEEKPQSSQVVKDNDGRVMAVIPIKKTSKKFDFKSWLFGFLGGIVGGLVSGGILYAILNVVGA